MFVAVCGKGICNSILKHRMHSSVELLHCALNRRFLFLDGFSTICHYIERLMSLFCQTLLIPLRHAPLFGKIQSPSVRLMSLSRANASNVEAVKVIRRAVPCRLMENIRITCRECTAVVRSRFDLIRLQRCIPCCAAFLRNYFPVM